MIKEIVLNNHVIKYQITFKNNKNTYFRFKNKGYIQINASRYQTHKGILDFIKKNKESFIYKYNKTQISSDDSIYSFLGKEYKKIKSLDNKHIQLDYENNIMIEPDISIDQLELQYKKMEKSIIIDKLNNLKEKHISNGYVDINDITFKTRYMQTRFGSCNPKRKTININLYLVYFDEKYLEYVFLHEISHLIHHNHSIDYYLLLSKLSNNYKQLKKELNNKFNYR